ncbi:MAG: hypothetical protein AB1481_01725, partial [Candidatus Omnitrophota bacterium]
AQEEITITTYYPSPRGMYNEVTLYPHAVPTGCDDAKMGTLYYDSDDNQIYVCKGTVEGWKPLTGFWSASTLNPNDIYNTNSGLVSIMKNLRLPLTASVSEGVIEMGTDRFIHAYSSSANKTNIFLGRQAGNFTMTGISSDNLVGLGYKALAVHNSNPNNTAVGALAMESDTSGYANTAVGTYALQRNTSGQQNSAIGYDTLANTTTGNSNVAVGSEAGIANTVGTNNTFVGANSGSVTGGTPNNLTNATAIGYSAQVTQNNSLILGGTGTHAVNVGIGLTAPTGVLDVQVPSGSSIVFRNLPTNTLSSYIQIRQSDGALFRPSSSRKYKKNIIKLDIISNKVFELMPVRFQSTTTGDEDIGFIAEDVGRVIKDLVVYNEKGEPESVKYDKVPLYLLEVIKEQQKKMTSLEARIDKLEKK